MPTLLDELGVPLPLDEPSTPDAYRLMDGAHRLMGWDGVGWDPDVPSDERRVPSDGRCLPSEGRCVPSDASGENMERGAATRPPCGRRRCFRREHGATARHLSCAARLCDPGKLCARLRTDGVADRGGPRAWKVRPSRDRCAAATWRVTWRCHFHFPDTRRSALFRRRMPTAGLPHHTRPPVSPSPPHAHRHV